MLEYHDKETNTFYNLDDAEVLWRCGGSFEYCYDMLTGAYERMILKKNDKIYIVRQYYEYSEFLWKRSIKWDKPKKAFVALSTRTEAYEALLKRGLEKKEAMNILGIEYKEVN